MLSSTIIVLDSTFTFAARQVISSDGPTSMLTSTRVIVRTLSLAAERTQSNKLSLIHVYLETVGEHPGTHAITVGNWAQHKAGPDGDRSMSRQRTSGQPVHSPCL